MRFNTYIRVRFFFLSLLTFPWVLSRLLKDYRGITLFFLAGLMAEEALRLLLRRVISFGVLAEPPISLLGAVCSGLAGVFLVYWSTRTREAEE